MQDFLKYIISPLLTDVDSLQITVDGSNYTVKVADADVGRLIGKQGNVINAIRTLVKTYCAVNRQPAANLILLTPPSPKNAPAD